VSSPQTPHTLVLKWASGRGGGRLKGGDGGAASEGPATSSPELDIVRPKIPAEIAFESGGGLLYRPIIRVLHQYQYATLGEDQAGLLAFPFLCALVPFLLLDEL